LILIMLLMTIMISCAAPLNKPATDLKMIGYSKDQRVEVRWDGSVGKSCDGIMNGVPVRIDDWSEHLRWVSVNGEIMRLKNGIWEY